MNIFFQAQSRHASALSTSKAAGMKSNRNNERDKFDMGFDDLGFDDPMDTMDTDLGFDDVDDNDKIDDFSISSDAGDYFFFFFFDSFVMYFYTFSLL